MDPVGNDVPGQARHRCRVLPPLAEGLLRLPHRRTLQLQLHVVVGGVGPVDGIGSDALPVATVIGVVAAAVVEVDAAEERPIVPGTVAIADDHHLLVVAAERQHPLVQHDLTARPVDGEGEPPVRTRSASPPGRRGRATATRSPAPRDVPPRRVPRRPWVRPRRGARRHRPATRRTAPSRRRPPRPALSPRRRSTHARAPAGERRCPRSTR